MVHRKELYTVGSFYELAVLLYENFFSGSDVSLLNEHWTRTLSLTGADSLNFSPLKCSSCLRNLYSTHVTMFSTVEETLMVRALRFTVGECEWMLASCCSSMRRFSCVLQKNKKKLTVLHCITYRGTNVCTEIFYSVSINEKITSYMINLVPNIRIIELRLVHSSTSQE